MLSDQSSANEGLDRLVVLIPAWEPDGRLSSLVDDLFRCGFASIVVVDDGSSHSCAAVFHALQQRSTVRVVTHERNLGKGRALKTGIDLILRELPLHQGVITADADGQHTAEDIARAAAALCKNETSPVLGVRTFNGDVPLRCRIGNGITRSVFRLLTGIKLSDTQTGLRGFPRDLLPELLLLHGERYEYEMVVLTHLCRTGRTPVEVTIKTLYLDGNRSSHFRPLRDSISILLALVLCVSRSQRRRSSFF
jgi:glycosyltransferase involved in cell wall biosynthesis